MVIDMFTNEEAEFFLWSEEVEFFNGLKKQSSENILVVLFRRHSSNPAIYICSVAMCISDMFM
jgi:hypothetical protein